MAKLIVIALSAALLTGAPTFSENDTPLNLTQAQSFTIVANILGAATACDGVAHERLSAVAQQVGARAMAKAVSEAEFTRIERLIMGSAAAGRKAVEAGQTDCKTVESAFGQLEQALVQTPV